MFRKILRHGAAYFDEEANTPGRLVHKLMSDTATLNRVNKLESFYWLPGLLNVVGPEGSLQPTHRSDFFCHRFVILLSEFQHKSPVT